MATDLHGWEGGDVRVGDGMNLNANEEEWAANLARMGEVVCESLVTSRVMDLHPLLAQFPVGEPGGEDGPLFQLGFGDGFAGVDVKIPCGREPLLPRAFGEHPGEETPHEVVEIRRPLMADLGEAEPHPRLAQFAAFLKMN